MNFSESYLIENYEKCLKTALQAKENGNFPLAKEKFLECAGFLESLVAVGDVSKREERKNRAERIRAIGESIDLKNPPKRSASVRSDYALTDGWGVEDGAFKDIDTFVTLIHPDELEFGFEGVMGLQDAKEAITEYVINPIKYPDAYNYNFMDNKAVLLFGPPGTGKTTFAKAVAKEVGQDFFLVNMAGLVNCYVGETAKNIDKIFEYIRSYVSQNQCDVVVFFDEMDEIAKKRGSDDKASESAVPALLRNLDGVKKNKGFMVIANTNYKDLLDDAILSRFRRRVFIPLPDKDTRIKLLRLQLKDLEEDKLQKLDFEKFGEASDGLSGRDIAYLADDFKRTVAKNKAGLIEEFDFNDELMKLIHTRKFDNRGES